MTPEVVEGGLCLLFRVAQPLESFIFCYYPVVKLMLEVEAPKKRFKPPPGAFVMPMPGQGPGKKGYGAGQADITNALAGVGCHIL